MANIFISHSSRDKAFVRRLAKALIEFGHQPWLDEWEIRVGESITSKIEEGLKSAHFVAIVLSAHSVASKWVDREWKAKYWDEIKQEKVVLLPLLIEECDIPTLLVDKKYADFRGGFDRGLVELINALDPSAEISAAALNIDEVFAKDVAQLLTRAHSSERLSTLLVDVMAFARERKQKALYNFCRSELHGYHDEKASVEVASTARPYRVVEFYASKTGSINPNYFQFNTESGLFNFIDRNPDKFVPAKIIDHDGMIEIEHKAAAESPTNTALYLKRPLGSINPAAKDPDRPVHMYARPSAYSNVIQSIRRELVQLLVALLPSM